MGYKATSTKRTSATSAVSNQTVVVNTPSGFSAVGSVIKSNSSISLGVTVVGQTSSASITTVSAGPTIANVQYLDSNNAVIVGDIAVSTLGGNILINGTGFVAGSSVYVNNALVSNTFISSTQIRAVLPSGAAGNVSLMVFTPTNVGTIGPAVRYSGVPTWTTAAVAFQNSVSSNVALIVSGDSTITYTLQAGSTLPTGISLSSSGYLTGTATGYSTTASGTFVVVATDAEGQSAQQTINWVVALYDAQFSYTSLLLSSSPARQTASFVKDNSSNNYPSTIVGDVRAQSFNPYELGYYSNYFGAGNYLTMPGTVAAFGSGNFTIECWLMANSLTEPGNLMGQLSGNNNPWCILFTGGLFYFQSSTTVANIISQSLGNILDGAWHHLAVTRSGTNMQVFLDGTSMIQITDSTVYSSSSSFTIGYGHSTYSAWGGSISNLRILKGTALYTSNFTPPTAPLTAIANTSLLTCQTNRFLDRSTNNTAITVAGTPKVSSGNPFTFGGASDTYGSAYIASANSNVISVPHNTNLSITSGSTDSFIAECWVYFNTVTASTAILNKAGINPSTFQNWSLNLDSAKKFQIIWGNTGSPGAQLGYISGTTVAIPGVWYHLAYVKTNADWSLFVNGVRETTFNGLNTASDTTSNPLRIGSDTFSSLSINGYIADVRIYKGPTAGAPYLATSTTLTVPTSPLTAITNTQLLTCQTNGPHNNSTFVDSSNFNNLITRNGNTSTGAFSPYSPVGWSYHFNGSTYLTASSSTAFVQTGAMTVEMWAYPTAYPASYDAALYSPQTPSSGAISLKLVPAGTLYLDNQQTGAVVTGATVVPLHKWTHIAFSRTSAGVWYLFVNGVSQGTPSSWTNVVSSTTNKIGIRPDTSTYYTGYISNMRVLQGTALYTSNFTPPTAPLTAIANTSFLTAASNRFVEISANTASFTQTGTSGTVTTSPFNASSSYSAASHGSSMYFDGTGDYLSIPYSSTFDITACDFTVEAWIYRTVSAEQYIVHQRPPSTTNGWAFEVYTGNVIRFYYTGGTTVVGTRIIPLNTWTHVAVSRSGSNIKMFVNGLADTATTITNGTTATGSLYVGTDNTPGSLNMTGYISDLRITKGVAIYTAAFTPPTAPLSPTGATVLLLNGTPGGINDAHTTVNLESVGDAKVIYDKSPYSSSSQSYYFDGTGDYLQAPTTSQAIGFGTGDYTVECWINFNANNGTYNPFVRFDSIGTFDFGYDFSTSLLKHGGSSSFLSVSQTFTPGTWYHVAVSRASGSCRMFVNGTQVGTTVTGNTDNFAIGAFKIGGSSYSGSHVMNGSISDLRITKGFARYTANFSVPTAPFIAQ